MNRRLAIFLITFGLVGACSASKSSSSGLTETWNGANAPEQFGLEVRKLVDLPKAGMLSESAYPWSDYYWATYTAGLSFRWQEGIRSDDHKEYLYDVLKPDVVLKGGVDVARLSPAEKFDLYMNRYDFPLTRSEQGRTLETADSMGGQIPGWFGLCHGWAPATLMEPEPGAVALVRNEKGLEIPFYTSDLKALITHIYSNMDAPAQSLGSRCNQRENALERDSSGRLINDPCRDTNPGSFHLALAELLGNPDPSKRRGFVADITVSSEVWNQAVVGYNVKKLDVRKYDSANDPAREHRAPGTAEIAEVEVEIYYITEIAPHLEPMKAIKADYTRKLDLSYSLELNEEGVIVGGEWISHQRPDFLWRLLETPKGDALVPYEAVKALVNKSLGLAEKSSAPVGSIEN